MTPAARSSALLAAFLLLAAGCSARFESFPFQSADGTAIDIRQSARRPRSEETVFQPTASRPASPTYSLAKPLVVPAGNQAFALSYTSSIADCRLSILSDRKTVLKSIALPASSGTRLRYLVPLAQGDRVWGFRLSAVSPESDRGTLQLMGAGTARMVHGFEIEPDGLAVDGSVAVLSASAAAVSARISSATRDEMALGVWVISLTLQPDAAGARVSFSGLEGQSAVFDVNPASTPARLDFAKGSMDFLPRDIAFTGSLKSLEISQVPADAPLPADPGLVLAWNQSSWRRPDFEVFTWSRYPTVLMLDTASYDVMDGLFNRLAFFVEKAGHAGRIESPAALAGIHGYNAHDYKADDLARFFSTAEKEGIPLTPEEGQLEKLLLENGVILKATTGYEPGQGSVIAISRSSSAVLRDLLLTHESYHGIYFSLPSFRDATEKEWGLLSSVEQEVWIAFLASRGYDTTDHYLMVNEFQSYLMQQERRLVPGFQSITLSRMRAASPRGASLATRLLATHPDSFLRSFDALDAALQSAGGPPGGLSLSVRESH